MTAPVAKVINAADDLVVEMLEGWVLAHPKLIALNDAGHIVRSKPKTQGRVALVIGNGTGHEPAMVGYVGHGLMDLNIPGPIFAAPSAAEIAKGVLAADRGAGVLVCVSNHTGDVMAAELALELLEAELDAPAVRVAILGEDIGAATENRADRRGGAGLLFVWKMLGAFAEQSDDLADCHAFALHVASQTASLSATLAAGSHPVSGAMLADIPAGQVLLGSGVHGEGSNTIQFETADHLVAEMIDRLVAVPVIGEASNVVLMINNAGSLTGMELGILARSAKLDFERRSVSLDRIWFGSYATTQEASGFTLAVCVMDDEMLHLYDAPALGASWFTGPVT